MKPELPRLALFYFHFAAPLNPAQLNSLQNCHCVPHQSATDNNPAQEADENYDSNIIDWLVNHDGEYHGSFLGGVQNALNPTAAHRERVDPVTIAQMSACVSPSEVSQVMLGDNGNTKDWMMDRQSEVTHWKVAVWTDHSAGPTSVLGTTIKPHFSRNYNYCAGFAIQRRSRESSALPLKALLVEKEFSPDGSLIDINYGCILIGVTFASPRDRKPDLPFTEVWGFSVVWSRQESASENLKIIAFSKFLLRPYAGELHCDGPLNQVWFARAWFIQELALSRRASPFRSTKGQMDHIWRANIAASLPMQFSVFADLSVARSFQGGQTTMLASHVKNRLNNKMDMQDLIQTNALLNISSLSLLQSKQDRVTIDSQYIQIFNNRQEWDLISTLIEVNDSSITNLIVNFRHLMCCGEPDITFKEIQGLLDTMIEDARRLLVRSPLLFRRSTRAKIVNSSNTRYYDATFDKRFFSFNASSLHTFPAKEEYQFGNNLSDYEYLLRCGIDENDMNPNLGDLETVCNSSASHSSYQQIKQIVRAHLRAGYASGSGFATTKNAGFSKGRNVELGSLQDPFFHPSILGFMPGLTSCLIEIMFGVVTQTMVSFKNLALWAVHNVLTYEVYPGFWGRKGN